MGKLDGKAAIVMGAARSLNVPRRGGSRVRQARSMLTEDKVNRLHNCGQQSRRSGGECSSACALDRAGGKREGNFLLRL